MLNYFLHSYLGVDIDIGALQASWLVLSQEPHGASTPLPTTTSSERPRSVGRHVLGSNSFGPSGASAGAAT